MTSVHQPTLPAASADVRQTVAEHEDAGSASRWQLQSSAAGTRFDESAVDAVARHEMERQRIPGLAVAVMRGDRVLMAKGYGFADLEHRVGVWPETMFESGSLGKQFTAAGIMTLVEQGVLALDASVRTYLPDAPDTWQPITLRHLLSHTSGIPDYTGDAMDYRRDYTDTDLEKMAFGLALEFPAGARWSYSNTGYVMLGVIIDKVTGHPYWELLRERIFAPAGMPTARILSEADIVPHRASGYELVDGEWKNQEWVSPSLNTTADGSLLFSLRDLIAWVRVVRERRILSNTSWDQMLTPVTLASGRPYPYGFGWDVETFKGQRLIGHGGAWQGFKTQLTRYEGSDVTVMILANSDSAEPGEIASAVAGTVDPELVPPPPPSTPIPDQDPDVTAYVRKMLGVTARGELSVADFEFVRVTIVPRMSAAYAKLLSGIGEIRSMDLLARGEEGDDRTFVYRVTCANGAVRASVKIGPGGRLTGLQLTKIEN